MSVVTDTFYLAFVAWREARGESDEAKLGVMHTVLNRVAKPGWWGNTVSTVVTKPWQYSSLTDAKDVQLTKWPTDKDATWLTCLDQANGCLAGLEDDPTRGATHYFDDSIAPPYWAKPEAFTVKLGRLNFYKLDA